MFGILNINKPTGWTSRDVVNCVQRLARPAKVGHAGTLDPLATGVLVVCVGPATRLIERVQHMPKRYVGAFQLGVTSDSDDTETELTKLTDAPIPELARLRGKLADFTGIILQRPPAFSAIKIKGRRAYEKARKGEAVDLPPREVTVHSLNILRYDYPELVLDIECGSGTYVRSLGRDLAVSLGTGAVMSALQRTSIGSFRSEESCTPQQLKEHGVDPFLQPATTALPLLPRVELNPLQVEEIHHGRTIRWQTIPGSECAATDQRGNLVAILIPRGPATLGPTMVFKPAT